MENALRANPQELREHYERQLKDKLPRKSDAARNRIFSLKSSTASRSREYTASQDVRRQEAQRRARDRSTSLRIAGEAFSISQT